MSFNPGAGSGGASHISTSSDVALSNPVDRQVLTYDSGIAKWRNDSPVSIVCLTESDFNALSTKTADTLYAISDTPTSMPLNTASSVYFGDEAAEIVYIGDQLVWSVSTGSVEPSPPPPTESPASSTELVANATFDVDIAGWSAGGNTTLSHETSIVQSGSGSLRLTSIAAGEIKTWSERFAVLEGTEYDFEAPVRAAMIGRVSGLQIDWYSVTNETPTYLSSSQHYATSSTAWGGRAVKNITPPTGASQAGVAIVIVSAGAGESHYVDSVTAKEAGAA